ncbi:MAG TPA: hypothetical protein VE959_02760 [Bryobacteraceae bacterium]|nr:hypothetical protein [Bryobacteraceae bacterium]
MRLFLLLIASLVSACAQTCVPARILPVDQVDGVLDDASCILSDGTAYAAYRLDLATRGQIRIDITAGAGDLIAVLQDSSGAKVDWGTSIGRPVESGSYTLLVNGRTRGQVGGYTVRTAFTAEAGTLCSAFPSIGLNQTASGTVGASGCVMPDGSPYEAYTLTTFGSGTLDISVAGGNASLILRDGDGHILASDPAHVTAPVDDDSEYQVVVAGAVGADPAGSAYQITTGFQPNDGETCRAAKVLDPGGDSDNNSITGNSCFMTIADSGDLSYFNYYNFTVGAAGLADLSVSSQDFLPTLYLLDDGGNVLATDSGGATASQSEIRLFLTPGNYTAQVFSPIPSGGAYSLAYQFPGGAAPSCVPVAANAGDAPAGSLGPASCRSSLGLTDIYSIALAASGTLDLTLNATGFGGVLGIRDAKDNLLIAAQDAQGLGVTQLSADLAAGAYTVVAAAGFGSGSYQLTTAFTAHDIPACSYVQPLDINGGYIQMLGPAGCRDADGQPMNLYSFTLPSDGVVLAVMTSSDVDGLLRLTDTAGNVLRTDENSYSPNDPMIVEFLPAGTYQLAARAAGSTVGGYYEVDLRTAPGPRPPFCASRGKLAPGATINATLSFTGCQYIDGTFADLYEIDLASSATIDVGLNSSDFDAYLVLLDAQGNVVDEDDDSGGGTNARMNLPLGAGTYFVVAKPFSDYYHVGNYTLSMGQLQ